MRIMQPVKIDCNSLTGNWKIRTYIPAVLILNGRGCEAKMNSLQIASENKDALNEKLTNLSI